MNTKTIVFQTENFRIIKVSQEDFSYAVLEKKDTNFFGETFYSTNYTHQNQADVLQELVNDLVGCKQ